jgi:hypothetical protein
MASAATVCRKRPFSSGTSVTGTRGHRRRPAGRIQVIRVRRGLVGDFWLGHWVHSCALRGFSKTRNALAILVVAVQIELCYEFYDLGL